MTSLNVRANGGVRYIAANVVSVARERAVLIVTSSEFVLFVQNGVVLNSTNMAVWLMNIEASQKL